MFTFSLKSQSLLNFDLIKLDFLNFANFIKLNFVLNFVINFDCNFIADFDFNLKIDYYSCQVEGKRIIKTQ